MNSKAIAYPTLLVPFVGVLVLLFSIYIVSDQADISAKYGDLAKDVSEASQSSRMLDSYYESYLDVTLPRQLFAFYLSNIGNCVYGDLQSQNFLYDDGSYCFDQINPVEKHYDFFDRANESLQYKVNEFESNNFRVETSLYNISHREVVIKAEGVYEKRGSYFQLEQNHSDEFRKEILLPYEFFNSNLFNEEEIDSFVNQANECDEMSCYEEVVDDYFSFDVISHEVVVNERESTTIIILEYDFHSRYDLKFAIKFGN